MYPERPRFRTESASDPTSTQRGRTARGTAAAGEGIGESELGEEILGQGRRQQVPSGSVGTHDVSLVELALVVVDDVGAGGEVRRHEDVGPVAGPARVALVVVRRRPLLRLLRVRPGPRHRRGWSAWGWGFRPQSCLRWGRRGRWRAPTSAGLPGRP